MGSSGTDLPPRLSEALAAELAAGNSIAGDYRDAFADVTVFVQLQKPFQCEHVLCEGIEAFDNRDSHYPVGRGLKDRIARAVLFAPAR